MPNSSLSRNPRIPYKAMRQVSDFCEPMRTRALFYLDQLAKQKQDGEDLTPADVSLAIGRAFRDKCDDQNVQFDAEALRAALDDANNGRRMKPLKELVNAD